MRKTAAQLKHILAHVKKPASYLIKIGLVVLAYLLIFSPETLRLDPMLFGGVKPIDMWHQIRESSAFSLGLLLFWLALATLVKLAGIFCGVIRWKLLLRGQGLSLPFWYMTYLWFAGRAIGLFAPGTLGLDGWRLVESSRYTGEWVKCTTVIAVEKLTGFIALTFLVFITFPFGFALLDINPVLFAGILMLLFAFTATCLLLLFNPRIIQVVVTVVPTPAKIRNIVHQIGAAATAYSAHRGTLLLACLFGLGVHVAICVMTFFTMLAIRAPNTTIFDIFFAAPLMIYASVITPTISGMGVRELVGGHLLGATAGYDAAVTFTHLGLWTGEFVPFLLSIPLLILMGRPSRSRLENDLKELRAQMGEQDSSGFALSEQQVWAYRRSVSATLLAGLFGGLMAGGLLGLMEAGWIAHTLAGLTDSQMFWWGPLVYGLLFAGAGLGVAAGLLFLYLLFDRFAYWPWTYALSFAGAFGAGGLVIGFFRYQRDVLAGHGATLGDYLRVVLGAGSVALVGGAVLLILALVVGAALRNRPGRLAAAGAAGFAALLLIGLLAGILHQPRQQAAAFTPNPEASGPNVILIVADTLRADYLRLYNAWAEANTPALSDLARDSVVFENSFAQASWTKASFGTLWTGLYPEQHTATGKVSALPEEVTTVAELLTDAGYFTKGFPNNPNIAPLFNFHQGFTEYDYLEPSLVFGAQASSAKLALYEVLRRVRQIGSQQLGRFIPAASRIRITEFYQPATVVTDTGLDWLDNGARPEESPFYLFLHYMDPHDPFLDPDYRDGGYARVRMPNPDPEQYREPMIAAYISEIEYMDREIGRLLDGLKERGLYDDALILFTSDHGEEFHEHGGWWHGQTLYDEQIHVPLIVKFPGNLLAGNVNRGIARHVDVTPTILHFTGVPEPEVMPGRTLYDTRAGLYPNMNLKYSYAENDFEGIRLRAVRTTETKRIEANPDNPRGLAPLELYDLRNDPGEQENLAGRPEIELEADDLASAIEEFQRVIAENAAEPTAPVDTLEMENQLRALGYAE